MLRIIISTVSDGWKGGSDKVVGHDVFITIKGEAHQSQ